MHVCQPGVYFTFIFLGYIPENMGVRSYKTDCYVSDTEVKRVY